MAQEEEELTHCPFEWLVHEEDDGEVDDAFEVVMEEDEEEAALASLREELGNLDRTDFSEARSFCNAYEALGKCGYVCRSAVKLANLDDIVGGALTKDTRRFADACAAPGGFSQYILSRSKARGLAMTLRGKNADGNGLEMFPQENLEVFYGNDGSGDVYVNGKAFAEIAKPCDLVVCDGGFDHSRNHIDQDRALERLAKCEFAVVLEALTEGGSCVLKLFLPLRSATSIIALAHIFFEKIALIKPLASRPTSGEVYLVALNFINNASDMTYAAKRLRGETGSLGERMTTKTTQFQQRVLNFSRRARKTLVRSQTDACFALLARAQGVPRHFHDDQRALCRRLQIRWGLSSNKTFPPKRNIQQSDLLRKKTKKLKQDNDENVDLEVAVRKVSSAHDA